jgi:hypothetical protein
VGRAVESGAILAAGLLGLADLVAAATAGLGEIFPVESAA